ncbi:hypothetical protein OROHE_011607 [Orobanche hederae]
MFLEERTHDADRKALDQKIKELSQLEADLKTAREEAISYCEKLEQETGMAASLRTEVAKLNTDDAVRELNFP